VNAVNELLRPVNIGEPFTPSVSYTTEEEIQVLLACAELCKTSEKVTRTGIRDKLGRNNKQYSQIIMPVSDKHRIAL
jgi:hypothetical protein